MSLEITTSTDGSTLNTGESYSLSKFVPILAFFTEVGGFCSTEFDLVSLVLKKPTLKNSYNYSNTSRKVLNYLNSSSFLRRVETNGLIIYIGKGVIYNEKGDILLCLTIETQYIFDAMEKKEYAFTIFSEYANGFVGYEPFIMFVSTEFANDKKYAILYRRIKKIYLDFCFEKGIEMRLISSSKIKENTFTNSLNIKFDSLTELNRHLTEDVKHLLQIPLEDFKERSFPLLLGIPPIPISKQEETVQRGNAIHQQVENYLLSRDSMLEDSDLDERAFEQEIVNLNLENLPSQTLSEMMDRINSQPIQWIDPYEHTSDAITASMLAIMATRRNAPLDLTEMHSSELVNSSISEEQRQQFYDAGWTPTTGDEGTNNVFPVDTLRQRIVEIRRTGEVDWGDGTSDEII